MSVADGRLWFESKKRRRFRWANTSSYLIRFNNSFQTKIRSELFECLSVSSYQWFRAFELKSPLSAKFQLRIFKTKRSAPNGKNYKLALHCFQWEKSGLKTTIYRNSGHFFQEFIFLCISAPQIAFKLTNLIRFE